MRALTLIAVVTLTGCYDLSKPDCGFTCGPAGECPSSYACNMTIHRCELIGSSPSCEPSGNDAGPSDSQEDVTGPRVVSHFPPSGAFAVNISRRRVPNR